MPFDSQIVLIVNKLFAGNCKMYFPTGGVHLPCRGPQCILDHIDADFHRLANHMLLLLIPLARGLLIILREKFMPDLEKSYLSGTKN